MATVYLSYAVEDRDFALQLAGAFRAYNISFSMADTGSVDSDWQTIEAEIAQCRCLVVLMSPDAARSERVQREIDTAKYQLKDVQPVLLRGEPFPLFLGNQVVHLNANQFLSGEFFYRIATDTIQSGGPTSDDQPFPSDAEEPKPPAQPLSPFESLRQLATVGAAGNPEIGDLVARAMKLAGSTGSILVDKWVGVESTIESVPGMKFTGGFRSPYFITDQEAQVAELSDPYVLVAERQFVIAEAVPLLEKIAQAQRPLVIFANSYDEELTTCLVVNQLHGILKACAVQLKESDSQAWLHKIARLTNATVLTHHNLLEDFELSTLGKATLVRVDSDETVVLGDRGDQKFDGRIVRIRAGGKSVDAIQTHAELIRKSLAATKELAATQSLS